VRKSQILSSIAMAVATPALLVTMAAPASAVVSASLTASCGYSQTCSGYAQDVPGVGASGTDVQVSCSATTPYQVQATVVRCYIVGNNGDAHWAPATLTQGQASTMQHRFPAWSLTSRSYQVCVGAGYYSVGGTYFAPAGYVCGASV
jgi:hypothetical protein